MHQTTSLNPKSISTEVLTVGEIADECKVSTQTVIAWIDKKLLRAYDVSSTNENKYSKWRVKREWLEDFIASRLNEPKQNDSAIPSPVSSAVKQPHHI